MNLDALPWILVVCLSAAAAVEGAAFYRQYKKSQSALSNFDDRLAEVQRRLNAVLALNRDMVQAADEKALIQIALSAINTLAGGAGSSFVPFDSWGQPLSAVTSGELPEPVMKGWVEHLASDEVRGRCSECKVLHALPEHTCPLQPFPGGKLMAIYCLPLALGGKTLGMVNLYLPPGEQLSPDLKVFLRGLLDLMALAVEAIRLQNQELVTLRQMQKMRSPRADLSTLLSALLGSLQQSIGVDALLLRLKPMADDRLSDLRVLSGTPDQATLAAMESMAEHALQNGGCIPEGFVPEGFIPGEPHSTLGVPLVLSGGQVLGTLLAVADHPVALNARQMSLLQTIASQAAVMIDNERANLSLEYRLVIQERTRLAREIHDGLAQTLAFLKMQAAQMQTALGQGDTPRLKRLLGENRQTLSDAYLETREAINNLRANPEDTLSEWLTQLASAFENSTGILASFTLQADVPVFLPEIQAQLVRIVQEALNNVRKHAQASQVGIHLREWSDDLVLEITDNGRGFDPDDVPSLAQYGLRGMRERAELIGADFQIISQPGLGTTVRLSLPRQLEESLE